MLFILISIISNILCKNIIIDGNTKTKSMHIKNTYNKCAKKYHNTDNNIKNKLIEQCILNDEIFSSVLITEDENSVKVLVKDKWSIIPIPMFSTDESTNKYGFMLVDANFLGYANILILGANFGNTTEYTLGLIGRTLFDTNLRAIFFMQKLSYSITAKDAANTYYENNLDTFKTFVSLGYVFNKTYTLSLGLDYYDYKFLKNSNFDKLNNYCELFLLAMINAEFYKYKLYFNEGLNFKIVLGENINYTSNRNFKYMMDYSYGFEIYKSSALIYNFNFVTQSSKKLNSSFKLGYSDGFRGLNEQSLWTNKYALNKLDYHIPYFRSDKLVLTVAPFFDLAFYENEIINYINNYYYSYGLGTYLFLKNITIPAVGVIIGHNSTFLGNFFAVSVGTKNN